MVWSQKYHKSRAFLYFESSDLAQNVLIFLHIATLALQLGKFATFGCMTDHHFCKLLDFFYLTA